VKYELTVAPGADPGRIRLGYRGATDLRLDGQGRLEVITPIARFNDDRPVAFQVIDGRHVLVAVEYELLPPEDSASDYESRREYRFRVGDYDRHWPLVIDPAVLIYCGYIGGSDEEQAGLGSGVIAVDTGGNLYVGGFARQGTGFPVTVGPDLTHNGGAISADDGWVAKVRPDGSSLVS